MICIYNVFGRVTLLSSSSSLSALFCGCWADQLIADQCLHIELYYSNEFRAGELWNWTKDTGTN